MVRGKKGVNAEKEGHTVSAWRCLRYRVYTTTLCTIQYNTLLHGTLHIQLQYKSYSTVVDGMALVRSTSHHPPPSSTFPSPPSSTLIHFIIQQCHFQPTLFLLRQNSNTPDPFRAATSPLRPPLGFKNTYILYIVLEIANK